MAGPTGGCRWRLVLVALVLLVSALGPALGPGASAEAAAPWRVPALDVDQHLVCTFDTTVLGEVSGLALSRKHPDVLWMTNDSGGGPYLYAVDASTCKIRATLTLLDTPARDHEALAVGTDAQGRDVIWIGDVGDNQGTWPYARIHKVIEPTRLRDQSVPVTTYRFTYPGGPVNAEALMADPDSEQLWVITKQSAEAGVYALPSPMSDSLKPMEAERVGPARGLITDAAMSPDGTRYVIRDYVSAEVFDGTPPGTAEARFRLPLQPQGEAVTWTAGGRSLLVASEGSGDLLEVAVPPSALGEDEGIAAVLPRVAGFDIYPYLRIAAILLMGMAVLLLIRRALRRR